MVLIEAATEQIQSGEQGIRGLLDFEGCWIKRRIIKVMTGRCGTGLTSGILYRYVPGWTGEWLQLKQVEYSPCIDITC